MLRIEPDLTLGHRIEPARGECLHLHEPLVGEHRLDDLVGPLRARYLQPVRFDRHKQALGVQIGDDLLAGLEAIQTLVGGGSLIVDAGLECQNADRLKPMALTYRPVVQVVGGGDLEAAGAKLRIDVLVADDGDGALRERQLQGPADERLVAAVLGMDGDRGVAQHRFRPRRGHHQ